MSFVIDENKVEELLRSSEPTYTVSVAPGGAAVENHRSCYGYTGIDGTVALSPATVSEEARGYLMSLRRKIEESGKPLQSADALANEIDRTRSR